MERKSAEFCTQRSKAIEAPKAGSQAGFPPDHFATQATGDVDSAPADGERKTVPTLFADIEGSTEFMEDVNPEEARAIIDPVLKLTIDAVRRYDGYVVQSTGDGIFALFGAPVAHEDHSQRTLYATRKRSLIKTELNPCRRRPLGLQGKLISERRNGNLG
ncbi:MAG: adenylate/guanylate cyclase domain-containing protein [Candidatus Binataceae bacterium]